MLMFIHTRTYSPFSSRLLERSALLASQARPSRLRRLSHATLRCPQRGTAVRDRSGVSMDLHRAVTMTRSPLLLLLLLHCRYFHHVSRAACPSASAGAELLPSKSSNKCEDRDQSLWGRRCSFVAMEEFWKLHFGWILRNVYIQEEKQKLFAYLHESRNDRHDPESIFPRERVKEAFDSSANDDLLHHHFRT